MSSRRVSGQWCCHVLLVLLVTLAGCATKPAKKPNYIFFPPAPDEPRIQFLTGFGSESDLAGRKKFAEFVTGSQGVHRPIWKPYGIASNKGFIYVADTQPCNVGVIDLAKRSIRYLKPEGQGAMRLPIGVAVDAEGTRYVADSGRNQVLIYGADNSFQGAIGKAQEMRPVGIAVAADKLYVTDLSNKCVRVYNKASREMLYTIPREPGKDEKGKMFLPTNVTLDKEGNLYVSDTGGFCVHIYDKEGKHIRSLGELGLNLGSFTLPKGVGVDRAKRLYVVDAATGVIQLFDDQSRLLMFFGEPKSGDGALYLPAGIAIDYDNVEYFQQYVAPGQKIEFLILVANQAGPHKVGVYGFLRKG